MSERRTQAMRSAATQHKLLEATLDALMESGYTRATTAEIADRAGVSRGALMHHYASKDDLVAAACQHLLRQATEDIRRQAREMEAGRLTLSGFLDYLWRQFSGRLFYVTLEHVTEARHNAELRAKMIPVVREFHAALDDIWREFFRGSALNPAEVETTLNMTLCLLRGMGVQTVLRDDPAYYDRLLSAWKQQLSGIVDIGHRTGSRSPPSGWRETQNDNPKTEEV